ncbi:MAG: hypothetical protein GWM98_21900, partial [Nitrospinaceae bacterium]|nr:hypothetical protein [Nitrospinaceae bacterium]NIR56615.1 hypothetical protein [Nitrospinaceae bacterium]NIS87078.1 hypothetical protein [Nitrospinaceae bacterium]NIT83932.1 hypothetical protein [Nitrospinaceae bacterium]NIU46123.1 hypothetical protein [Nitrospinaceae bacterium]
MKILVIGPDSEVTRLFSFLSESGHLVQSCPDISFALQRLEYLSYNPLVFVNPEKMDPATVRGMKTAGTGEKDRAVMLIGKLPGSMKNTGGFDYVFETPPGPKDWQALMGPDGAFREKEPLDFYAAIELCDGDQNLFFDIAGIFLKDGPRRIEGLRTALAQKSYHNVQESAHLMKGSALNLVAAPLCEATRFLESSAGKSDLTGIEDGADYVIYEYERLKNRLTRMMKERPSAEGAP